MPRLSAPRADPESPRQRGCLEVEAEPFLVGSRFDSDVDLEGAGGRRGTIRFGALSASQSALEERLRTVCLVICAGGVVSYGLSKLKFALVPLVLSLALKYLLQPMIDALTRRHGRSYEEDDGVFEERCRRKGAFGRVAASARRRCRRVALPHSLAVLVSLALALAFLGGVVAVVTESVRDFTSRADQYAEQVQNFLVFVVRWMDKNGIDRKWRKSQSLEKVADKLQLSSWVTATVFSLGEGLLSVLSTTALVILFTLYLLLTPTHDEARSPSDPPSPAADGRASGDSRFSRRVDRQINAYIKGKLGLSFLVGALTAALLCALNVDLWLAFSVIAFFANFVPNIGAVVAIVLPLPVILIDPRGSPANSLLAFASLVVMHAVVGNVVEPILFGHSMKLHPVVVLLSLMIWGFIWGIPGCVLAVPITAILRIYLASVDHPLSQLLANILDGFARPVHAFLPDDDALGPTGRPRANTHHV